MQNRRSIEVLFWNEGKILRVALRIEEFIDQVSVAKTQVIAVGQQLRLSTVIIRRNSVKLEEPVAVRHR